jgi:hypothetical protein
VSAFRRTSGQRQNETALLHEELLLQRYDKLLPRLDDAIGDE